MSDLNYWSELLNSRLSRRRILSLTSAGLGVAALTSFGCGSDSADSPPTSTSTTTSASAATDATPAPTTSSPAFDEEALIAAAKQEGSGVFYSIGSNTADLVDAFTKKYGINIDLQRLSSGPVIQRFSAESEIDNFTADWSLSRTMAWQWMRS